MMMISFAWISLFCAFTKAMGAIPSGRAQGGSMENHFDLLSAFGPFIEGSAAAGEREREPGLHFFTQYVLQSLRMNKNVSSGYLESGRAEYGEYM